MSERANPYGPRDHGLHLSAPSEGWFLRIVGWRQFLLLSAGLFTMFFAGRCSAQDPYHGVPHAASPTAFWPTHPHQLPDNAGWAPCCSDYRPYPHVNELEAPTLGGVLRLGLSQTLPQCGQTTWIVGWGVSTGQPLLQPFLYGGRCPTAFALTLANEPWANDWLTPPFQLSFQQFPLIGQVPIIAWQVPAETTFLGQPFYAQCVITRIEGRTPNIESLGQVRTWLLQTSPAR